MSTQPLLQRTAQKRIALPVKVEPKVFFANERSECEVYPKSESDCGVLVDYDTDEADFLRISL